MSPLCLTRSCPLSLPERWLSSPVWAPWPFRREPRKSYQGPLPPLPILPGFRLPLAPESSSLLFSHGIFLSRIQSLTLSQLRPPRPRSS